MGILTAASDREELMPEYDCTACKDAGVVDDGDGDRDCPVCSPHASCRGKHRCDECEEEHRQMKEEQARERALEARVDAAVEADQFRRHGMVA